MIKRLFVTIFGLIAILNCHAISATGRADQPNVVLFLVDDLGWIDVGYMGSKYYETPNINKLSQQGVLFTNAYAACAVCSPTRASIQTGKYPARLGITDWIRARFQLSDKDVKAPPPFEENGNKTPRTPSNPFWLELTRVPLAEI